MEKVRKLELFHGRITSCRAVVQAPPGHPHTGGRYQLRLTLEVPRGFIVIDRESSPSLDEAIERAFDAAARRLEDRVRRSRSEGTSVA